MRSLSGVILIAWLAATVWLLFTADEEPLLSLSFSSSNAIIWLGVGVFGFLLAVLSEHNPNRDIYSQVFADYLNEAVVVCTVNGKPRWWNQAAQTILIDNQQLPESVQPLLKKVRDAKRVTIQVLPIGSEMRYSVQAIPLDNRKIALIFRPSQSEKSTFYENFIRRIVHDMRNPLAAIVGHAANLRQGSEIDLENWQRSASTIENEAQRLARLVDSMLFDARLAYVPLSLETLDLADVLEEALYAHEEQAIQNGKSLEIDLPPGRLPFQADRDLLVRAFSNLIDNGLKYSDTNGHVNIRLENHQRDYIVTFEDNGYGIPTEYLPDRIFEPLVRARSGESGSGLGLAIVKKIVEMHQGTIIAQSAPGKGTAMIVTLSKDNMS